MSQPNDTAAGSTADGSRLEQFHQEVGRLQASGGRANPDRWVFRIGVILTIVGLAFTLVSFFMTGDASDNKNHLDLVVSALFGVSLTLVGLVMITVSSFRRFMRYWLVRLIYEHREQTDRVANR
ncbi:hypothetical protein [Candidatus Poriferisocius sp.]|uniref:hypothetical protein n=1 Tax=Candidatus Poriferisocius sp. TaxID=3101276 RepID=UPI003B014259